MSSLRAQEPWGAASPGLAAGTTRRRQHLPPRGSSPVSRGLFSLHFHFRLEDVTACRAQLRGSEPGCGSLLVSVALSSDPKACGSSLWPSLVLAADAACSHLPPAGPCLRGHRPCHLGRAGPACAPRPPVCSRWALFAPRGAGRPGRPGRGRSLRAVVLRAQCPGRRRTLAFACCPQCSSRCVPFMGGFPPAQAPAAPQALPPWLHPQILGSRHPQVQSGAFWPLSGLGVGVLWLSCLAVLRGVSVSLVVPLRQQSEG